MDKPQGFTYSKTPYRFVAEYKDGKWINSGMSQDENIVLNESACVFQYAQTCFEGLKAYRTKDGSIVCFRPELNVDRMSDSCKRMVMPVYPKDDFLKAIDDTILANEEYIPEYGDGSALYLRPFMIGTNPVLGVKPASEFQLRIFASPVGPYFATDNPGLNIRICDYDRAAPHGTGHIKAGLNYALSLYAITEAHALGFDENLYLDSATRTYIEETGGANVFFVTKDNKIVTPKSDTILPSVTRRSMLEIAKEYLGLEVEERKISLSEIGDFKECGLCGTAAVIAPVRIINDHGKEIKFDVSSEGFGPLTKKLRETMLKIQFCDIKGPSGWIHVVKQGNKND